MPHTGRNMDTNKGLTKSRLRSLQRPNNEQQKIASLETERGKNILQITNMKLLLLCIAIVGSVADKHDEEVAVMKRLLEVLKQEDSAASIENGASDKRYLYQTIDNPSPSVLKSRPGEMRVDLQMDITVMNECPDCRMFVNFQCVSNECHNKAVRLFPENGYSWTEFRALFVTPIQHDGVWVDGLESGMEYKVWDSVTLADTLMEYGGYQNTERREIRIP
ncbi:hypothetical protein LSAT2_022765 [Lamellibrachia satsuma]|nr:hypothetical protein LSAT2_022765 [Lamellibrachia satsuma]